MGATYKALAPLFNPPDLFLLDCENVSHGWGHTIRLFSLSLRLGIPC